MLKNKDLSVITVSYQSREFIPDLVMSVVTGGVKIDYEHIIVDNASTDGTAEFVKEHYAAYVQLIVNAKNVGFAKANNQALERASGRYILFLNPDMRVEELSLDKIVEWMDLHPHVGIAGCKLVDERGFAHADYHPRRFPNPLHTLGFFLCLSRVFPSLSRSFYYENFEVDQEMEVDHVRGAFMLVRRALTNDLKRSFDPRYFLLIEDLDFCREAKVLGYKIVYTPIISCVDFFQRSFAKRPGYWKFFRLAKSLWLYTWKWERGYWGMLWILVIPIGVVLRLPKWIGEWTRDLSSKFLNLKLRPKADPEIS